MTGGLETGRLPVPIQTTPLIQIASVARFAACVAAWICTIAMIRAVSFAMGAQTAAVLAAGGSAALAFAAGRAFAASPAAAGPAGSNITKIITGARFATIAALVICYSATALAPWLSSWIRQAGGFGGVYLCMASLVLCGAPLFAAGFQSGRAAPPSIPAVAASAIIAIVLLDSPLVPAPLARVLPAVILLYYILFPPRTAPRIAPPAEPRGALLISFFTGAAVTTAGVFIGVCIYFFQRDTPWNHASAGVVALGLFALGALPIFGTGNVRKAAIIVIPAATAALLLTYVKLCSLCTTEGFHGLLTFQASWLGNAAALDGPLQGPALVVLGVPLVFILCGTATAATTRDNSLHTASFAAGTGLAAIVLSFVKSFPLTTDPLHHPVALGVLAAAVLFTISTTVTAVLVLKTMPGLSWKATALLATAASIICILFLRPPPFQPGNLFQVTRVLSPEVQDVAGMAGGPSGIATWMNAPDILNFRYTRIPQIRLGRMRVSPPAEADRLYQLCIARAALHHGSPAGALLAGPATPQAVDILQTAGVSKIQFEPVESVLADFPAGVPATNALDARPFDMIILPPFAARGSRALAAMHPALWQGARARMPKDGVFISYHDLSSTAPQVLEFLIEDGRRSGARFDFISNGLIHPILEICHYGSARRGNVTNPAWSGTLFNRLSARNLQPGGIEGPGGGAGPAASRAGLSQVFDYITRPVAPDREIESMEGRDYYDSGPRATVVSNCRLLIKAFLQMPAALRLQLNAIEAFHAEPWTLSNFHPPIMEFPVPPAACKSVAELLKFDPESRAGVAASLQLIDLMQSQRLLSQLLDFSTAASEAAPGFWQARISRASALRELLDPEGAIALLQGFSPSGASQEIATAVERARCDFALGHRENAINGLRRALTAHPVSPDVTRALFDLLLLSGRLDEAQTIAGHYFTISKGSPDAAVLTERVEAARAASRPGGVPSHR